MSASQGIKSELIQPQSDLEAEIQHPIQPADIHQMVDMANNFRSRYAEANALTNTTANAAQMLLLKRSVAGIDAPGETAAQDAAGDAKRQSLG